jgi:heme exporter protein C
MREKAIFALLAVAGALLSWNLYKILLVLPDEASQGAIWRIFYFHVPSAILGMTGAWVSLAFSAVYLWKRDLWWDGLAAAVIEVSLVLISVCLVTGSIWGRISWGIWWTWDPRLTSAFVCWLMYVGYLMLRRAVEEPAQRARLSAVLVAFSAVNVVIVWKSIEWWRTQHPGPVLSIRKGGGMAPGMEAVMMWNLLAILCLVSAFVMLRMRQQQVEREIDSLRRMAHAM